MLNLDEMCAQMVGHSSVQRAFHAEVLQVDLSAGAVEVRGFALLDPDGAALLVGSSHRTDHTGVHWCSFVL